MRVIHIIIVTLATAISPLAWGPLTLNAATHEVTKKIATSDETKCAKLSSFCILPDDNLALTDTANMAIKVISPDDKVLKTIELEFSPLAIGWWPQKESFVVAGANNLALVKDDKIVKSIEIPYDYVSSASGDGNYVFVTGRAGRTGFAVTRYDDKLENPKEIIKGLSGCCGQMDVQAYNGDIYVAANTSFEMRKYSPDGNVRKVFKKPSGVKYWDGCCEPKNSFLASDNKTLYVTESAQCAMYTFDAASGKMLEEIVRIPEIGGCVRVTVAASKDGKTVYMLDQSKNLIHVAEKKK